MKTINTVTGAIAPQELGFCQSHEHIFIAKCKSFDVNRHLIIDEYDLSLRELCMYKAAGGGAIADAQPIGAGRDCETLERLSYKSGVNIIAATGFHKTCFYHKTHWALRLSSQKLADIYTAELKEGMFAPCDYKLPDRQTGIKAGFIKAALEDGWREGAYARLFEAAALAGARTDKPIMIHVEKGSKPMELYCFLNDRGIAARHMIFCHMDRACPDLSEHLELLDKGVYLEYDTIGRFKYHSDERELEIIKAMLDAGHGKQLLMGLDTTRARLRAYGGAIGLSYILESFLPRLMELDKSADMAFLYNPAHAFSH